MTLTEVEVDSAGMTLGIAGVLLDVVDDQRSAERCGPPRCDVVPLVVIDRNVAGDSDDIVGAGRRAAVELEVHLPGQRTC